MAFGVYYTLYGLLQPSAYNILHQAYNKWHSVYIIYYMAYYNQSRIDNFFSLRMQADQVEDARENTAVLFVVAVSAPM